MRKLKDVLSEKPFIRYSLFIACNALLLYALYFIIKNFDVIAVALYEVVSAILSAFWPLILGLIFAYLLDPLVGLIDRKFLSKVIKIPDDPIKAEKRKGLSRLLSVLLTFLFIVAVVVLMIYGFAALIVGKVVFGGFSDMINAIIKNLTSYESDIKSWAATNLPEGFLSDKLQSIARAIMGWLSDHFSTETIIGTLTSIGGSIANIFIGAVASIYLIKDKEFFLRLWRKFLHLTLPQKAHATVSETLSDVNSIVSLFVRGTLLDALIIAVLSSIGLTAAGLDFAVFIGIFAGICNIIPYFGPLLGMIPAFLVGMFTEGFGKAAIAVIVLVVIQQIDCNLIYPKVVGGNTGLHPLIVLIAVSVGGYFAGIIGMILAVPITGVLQAFIKRWAEKKERRIETARPGDE